MTTLTLYKAGGCWVMTDPRPDVRSLFGTDTLPTAWTDRAPVETVRAEIQRRNPGCVVEVRPSRDLENVAVSERRDMYRDRE
jgi:hypothetical protein